MSIKNFIFIAIVMLSLAGCADSYNVIRQNTQSTATLSSSDSFYISLSKDGVYGEEAYPGSGLTLSQIILSSIAKHARRIVIATKVEPYEEALKSARDKKYDFLFYPTILHWENHATEWNGVPDRVKVKIEVIAAATDTLLDSAIIEGRSGTATFGGDQPQDLLPTPIEEFVSSMFKTVKKPTQD